MPTATNEYVSKLYDQVTAARRDLALTRAELDDCHDAIHFARVAMEAAVREMESTRAFSASLADLKFRAAKLKRLDPFNFEAAELEPVPTAALPDDSDVMLLPA